MRRGMPVIWGLVKPLVIYYIGYYVVRMVVGTLLAGGGKGFLLEDGLPVVNGIAMLGGCAFLFPIIEEEREEGQREKRSGKGDAGKRPALYYLALAVFAVASVVFFNTLVSLTGLSEKSAAFQETARNQFAVPLGIGLLLYGVISPLAEEVVFRFLLYNRLRRFGGMAFGVVASAFLFGLYHGNIVQAVYAFILGVLIACAYLYFNNFLAPVLFHGLGNAVIFLGNSIPELYGILFSPLFFWLFGLLTAAGCFCFAREQGLGRRKPDAETKGE